MKITKEVSEYGTIRYYNELGYRHREDGPAVEWSNGYKVWYSNGLLHREDGPAKESANGDKEWWLNDKEYSEQEFNDYILRKRLQRIMEL